MKKIAKLMTLALAVFTLASCEDVPSPFGTVTPPPTPSQVLPTGDGTASNPFNVTAAVAKCKEIGSTESTEKYYVTGVVVTAGAADAQYGNATFVISDEGSSAKFTCFQVLGSDGKKMREGFTFNVGDVVVVYGPMYNYKGNTPETAGKGAAYVVTVNGKKTDEGDTPTPSGDAKGTGTQADPFNIAAAIIKCQEIGTTPSTEKYYIKGIVVKGGTATGGYGNISFDMGDTKDATATFKAFQVAGSDGEKLADGYTVNAGDEVVVYGPIYNYQGNTPETAGKSAAQIVTINGKKTSEGGGGTPSGEAKAVTIAEFNAAAESTDVWYQLTGTIKSLKEGDQYGNFDLEDATGSVYVYGLLSEKGGEKKKFQELVAAQGLQAGTKITIIGNRGSYNGQIQVANAYFVKVEGGGDTPGGGDSGNELTVAASSLGLENGVEVGSKTLTDGTTLTCDGGGNTNAPKYYTAGNGTVRMYPNNTMALNASKKIASIEIVCNEYNGTLYNASGNVTATSGTKAIEGAVVKFTGINASSVTINNSAEGSGAATQIRWESLKITYAE